MSSLLKGFQKYWTCSNILSPKMMANKMNIK
jgi:hypothetical protein